MYTMMLKVVLLIFMSVRVMGTFLDTFRIEEGVRLEGGTILEPSPVQKRGMSAVLCASYCQPPCQSATFSLQNQTCLTFLEMIFDLTLTWVSDPDWAILYTNITTVDTIQDSEGWVLVFRGQSLVNETLLEVWNRTGVHHDHPVHLNGPLSASCFRLDNVGMCKSHFRSYYLDNWEHISLVRFSVYKKNSEVKNIIFNGSSSNVTSWFRRKKILSSTWSKLKGDKSIDALGQFHLFPFNDRHFYITGPLTGNCSEDTSYFMAGEHPLDPDCGTKWKVEAMPGFPVLLFSPGESFVLMEQMNFADFFTVSIQLDSTVAVP